MQNYITITLIILVLIIFFIVIYSIYKKSKKEPEEIVPSLNYEEIYKKSHKKFIEGDYDEDDFLQDNPELDIVDYINLLILYREKKKPSLSDYEKIIEIED